MDGRLGTVRTGPELQDDGRARFAAHPAGDLVKVLADRRSAVDLHDLLPDYEPSCLGRAAVEDTHDERQLVRGDIDTHADADVGTRQVAGTVGTFLGRQERGVAGVADRLGHPADRAVDEVLILEVAGPDILLVEDVPRLADQPELGARAGGRVRGGRLYAAHDGQRDAADPDPDTERHGQRQPDNRATCHRTASTAGRR